MFLENTVTHKYKFLLYYQMIDATVVPMYVDAVRNRNSRPAILRAIRKLGLERLLGTKRGRERDLVVAMMAERLIHPVSKLACGGNDE